MVATRRSKPRASASPQADKAQQKVASPASGPVAGKKTRKSAPAPATDVTPAKTSRRQKSTAAGGGDEAKTPVAKKTPARKQKSTAASPAKSPAPATPKPAAPNSASKPITIGKVATPVRPLVVPPADTLHDASSKQTIEFGTARILVSDGVESAKTAAPATARPRELGRPVSSKTWQPRKDKFSKAMSLNAKNKTWRKKEDERIQWKSMKERERDILEQRKNRLRTKREKTLQKQKNKAANELKSLKVQTITNTAKIKKMSKKQLAMIRKI